MSVIESTVDGRYQVIARIASGGMGEVYRAHDAVLGREVALKVLHPQYAGDAGFVDRFRREARAAAILNHPNIVGVYDWGNTEGTYFMVMEFVRGMNLRSLLLEHGRLEPAQVVEAALQVLAALGHAHDQGIVHRDVKPENILITESGVVKVADFGLARAFADSHVSQAEGTVTGTVQYLAPEQVLGEPADPRTDLYALGVVMFELLTGRPPFGGETSLAIAYQHLSGTVPAPSAVVAALEPSLDEAVLHATARDRGERPASARALADEVRLGGVALPPAPSLAALAAEMPTAELPTSERATTVTIPRARSPRARRRRRLRLLAMVLGVLVLLAGGAWAAWLYAVPHYAGVPRLAGLTVGQAELRLEAAGFTPKIGDPVFSHDLEAGLVVRTSPAPGTRIRRGATVVLTPSKGPQLIGVPRVVDAPLAQARTTLKDAGFVVKVSQAFSDTVAKDRVISQSPDPGTPLEKGSDVTVTVSRGPELQPVPDVAGQAADVATGTLQSLEFQVTVSEEFSTSVPKGVAIGTDPPSGERVPKGSAVTLRVSKGPETFPMPRVIGMSSERATATLRGLGLVVKEVQVPGSIGDTVVGQQPPPGKTVSQGQQVTIYVGG